MTTSVLVITRDYDTTADLVVDELDWRGVRTVRFDLADFPQKLDQIAYLVNGRTRWSGAIRGRYRDIDLSTVRAAWWRKPSHYSPHAGLTSTEQQWATAEAITGFGGLLAALPAVRWVNHPHHNAEAEYKPHQLSAAAHAGLTVADTLITNDPDHARLFCRTHAEHGVVYKPLRGGPGSENGQHVTLRASSVTESGIRETVRATTHLFQERVPCDYAVRMTVVGARIFAVRLDPPAGSAALDWREYPSDQLTYTPVAVPAPVAAGVHRLTASFGLVYAAPDFIVTPSGEWVFHGDLNPNGQWGWIAGHTGLPIASALADELTQEPA